MFPPAVSYLIVTRWEIGTAIAPPVTEADPGPEDVSGFYSHMVFGGAQIGIRMLNEPRSMARPLAHLTVTCSVVFFSRCVALLRHSHGEYSGWFWWVLWLLITAPPYESDLG